MYESELCGTGSYAVSMWCEIRTKRVKDTKPIQKKTAATTLQTIKDDQGEILYQSVCDWFTIVAGLC